MRLSVLQRDGFRLLNLGPEGWTEEAARRYQDEICDGVGLEPDRPFADLDFLRPLSNLRVVSVGAATVKDPSALFDKVELEELDIGRIRDVRGLSRLRRLRVLGISYVKGVEEIAELTELEQLQIGGWPRGTDLELIGPKPKLRALYLTLKRTAEVSSSWFGSAPTLTDLNLYFGRLRDTAGLTALTKLANLRFADTKIPDVNFVSAMPALRRLELDNAGDIVSLAPLRGHPALTELYVIGGTQVLDGDLDVRADLPSLRMGSVGNRPFGTSGD